jgi:predicted outer membrane repeat protein
MSTKRRHSFRPSLQILEDRCVPATFTVTNLLDDGSAGSLRKRIELANVNPSLDTIVFKPGLEGTIKLTGELEIKGNTVIAGPGASKITIDASAASRIFNIDDSTSATKRKVTISGLTLFNGRVDGIGGAVLSREDLTLIRTTFIGNVATDFGGAIEAVAGNLVVKKSRLSGNRADFGGAIDTYQTTSVRVVNSVLTGNRSSSSGGAIYSNSATTIRGSTIAGNFSGGSGGGIRQHLRSLTIENSTIAGNQATQGGGGVYSSNATTKVANATIQFNRTDTLGGGIRQSGGSLELQRSTVSGNSASNGGGIFIYQTTATSVLASSAIAGNFSQTHGGGVTITTIAGTFTPAIIRNCTIAGNQAEDFGGGLFTFNTDTGIRVNNSTITFNRASTSGGIHANDAGVTLESTIVALNLAGTSRDVGSASGGSFTALTSLVGSTAGATFSGDAITTNPLGQDPLLAPLAKNGGPTETHALKKGSPAINKGSNPDNLKTDQRGGPFKRKLGPAVDMGAFERQ